MNKIVIAIPTFKRPLMLKSLLLSIKNCSINSSLIEEINIVVVDNDIQKSAEETIQKLILEHPDYKNVRYHNFTEKGLSNVRNEMLKKAFEYTPDFIVFIDDDERVSSEWLNELVKVIVNNNADVARGPVLVNMEVEVPDSISCWFTRENYPDNYLLNTLTSGNLIMRYSSILSFGIWFDMRFNTTGSEDSFFGKQLLKKGAKMHWAAHAIAYETIPKSRATLHWLILRNYREAGTFTYILKVEKQYFKLLKKTMISFLYVLVGILTSVLIVLPIKKRYWGVLKISEGLGGIAGLGNKIYNEYK